MGNIGVWELIIIVILVVIIFGGRKLPELGRGLGQGLANFRRAVREPDQAGQAREAEHVSPETVNHPSASADDQESKRSE